MARLAPSPANGDIRWAASPTSVTPGSSRSSPPDDLVLHGQRVKPGADSARQGFSCFYGNVGNANVARAAMLGRGSVLDEEFGVRRRQLGEQAAHGPLGRVDPQRGLEDLAH